MKTGDDDGGLAEHQESPLAEYYDDNGRLADESDDEWPDAFAGMSELEIKSQGAAYRHAVARAQAEIGVFPC